MSGCFNCFLVELLPVPAMVKALPAYSWVFSITLLCSFQSNVGLSPVVPTANMPLTPFFIGNLLVAVNLDNRLGDTIHWGY
jgi:hypothetical protein